MVMTWDSDSHSLSSILSTASLILFCHFLLIIEPEVTFYYYKKSYEITIAVDW